MSAKSPPEHTNESKLEIGIIVDKTAGAMLIYLQHLQLKTPRMVISLSFLVLCHPKPCGKSPKIDAACGVVQFWTSQEQKNTKPRYLSVQGPSEGCLTIDLASAVNSKAISFPTKRNKTKSSFLEFLNLEFGAFETSIFGFGSANCWSFLKFVPGSLVGQNEPSKLVSEQRGCNLRIILGVEFLTHFLEVPRSICFIDNNIIIIINNNNNNNDNDHDNDNDINIVLLWAWDEGSSWQGKAHGWMRTAARALLFGSRIQEPSPSAGTWFHLRKFKIDLCWEVFL